jgi:phospholipid-binding lipoprotein MlaA
MRTALIMGMALLALCGCASRDFTIRSVPSEMPAADNAAAAYAFAALAAAQKQLAQQTGEPANAATAAPLTTADAPSMYTYDPWERLNRFTYRLNARFDEAIFLPVANGYRRAPAPLRAGVHNFIENLSEVDSVVNYAVQLRPTGSVRSLGRFVINSTLGIGGLFDVATKLKLKSSPTGFGATLSTWGMHPGPYIIIPLIGPSTLRDGIGLLGDFGIEYAINVAHLYRGNKTWFLGVADSVDKRSNISFRYYSTGSPFEYETVRFLYVHKELIEDEALRTTRRRKEGDGGAPAGK